MTEWRNIPGYPRYEISGTGCVRTLRDGYELKQRLNWRGYRVVALTEGEPLPFQRGTGKRTKQREMRVHRLVAMTFIPNPDNLPEVNHKDLDKTNNSVANLEWITHIDNHRHCLKMGKYNAVDFAERRRKLTPDDVIALREMRRTTGATYKECGERFGVDPSIAAKIARGVLWPNLPGAVPRVRRTSSIVLSSEQRAVLLAMMPAAASTLHRESGFGVMASAAALQAMQAEGMIECYRVKTKMTYRQCNVPSKTDAVE